MRSRLAATGLAVAIVVLLAANATVLVTHDGGGGGGSDDSVAIEDGNGSSELEGILPELVAFVEQSRGLTFKRPPRVKLLADDDFEALFLDDGGASEDAEAEAEQFIGFLRALGLIEGEVDLDAVMADAAEYVVGFYDPEERTLYARGSSATPYVQLVLVHELTHALDDQYFDLDPEFVTGDDSSAFDTLVEGSAMVVEQAWFDSRSANEQDAIQAEEQSGIPDEDTLPEVFGLLFDFPYAFGPAFVEALLDGGGHARLDSAFENPPESSEHVMHPEKFLAGENPREVDAPASAGEVFDEGSLGELGLYLVLGSATEGDTAEKAAEGWAGDSYVAWTDGPRTCVRWRIVMDTGADTRELVAAFRTWSSRNPTAQVRGSDPLEVTSCR